MGLLAICALVMVRIFAVTMTAPILGSRAVGVKTRMAISVVLMMLALPLVHVPEELRTQTAIDWVPFIFSEAAIGITLGLGVSIMFSAASATGVTIGQLTGLQLGGTEANEGRSPIARFYHVVSVAAFAIIGGPALVLTSLLDTFIHIPLATTLTQAPLLEMATQLLQQSFMLMLRAIGPVLVALMGSNFVMGIISRTYPQMNLLGMGLGSNLIVMFMSIFLSLGGTVWLFVDDLKPTIERIEKGFASAISPAQTPQQDPASLPSGAIQHEAAAIPYPQQNRFGYPSSAYQPQQNSNPFPVQQASRSSANVPAQFQPFQSQQQPYNQSQNFSPPQPIRNASPGWIR